MTCHEIKGLTVPYLELDLEPSRVRDVTAHLDGCAGCRAEMEVVRQILVRVKVVAVPDPGDRFWNEFPGTVRRELARERLSLPAGARKGTARWPMALAASLLLLVGAWWLKGPVAPEPALSPSQPRAVAQAPTAPDSPLPAFEPDLPQLAETDWLDPLDEDPDMALVDMASGLDRQSVDRLFRDI